MSYLGSYFLLRQRGRKLRQHDQRQRTLRLIVIDATTTTERLRNMYQCRAYSRMRVTAGPSGCPRDG